MPKTLAIITSKENYVWFSMTEIIPWIESIWHAWGKSRNFDVQIIDVDDLHMKKALMSLIQSELLVVTCFNLKIARFITSVRHELSLDVRMVFYLHNQATIGCWPLINWKLIENMTENDIFIGTCQRDLASMKLNFLNGKTMLIPFSLKHLPVREEKKFKSTLRKFSFIGRLSAQKNLHTLIWSLSIMRHNFPHLTWELHLFGKDDELGSPLMGLPQEGYEDYLRQLVKKLSLEDAVFFRGFVPREEIETEMNNDKWIFVSPSLHGDENFGMAAFRSLMNGHLAVLSDWGGHSDFIKHFPSQAQGVRVNQSDFGPWIDAWELASALFLSTKIENGFDRDVSFYEEQTLFLEMDKVRNAEGSQTPLFPTPLAMALLKQRAHFVAVQERLILQNKMKLKQSQRWCQIFEDYRDKNAHLFHKAYGMENLKHPSRTQEIQLAPWVSREEKIVNDPHRGTWPVPENEITLLENGWATGIKQISSF